MVGVVMDIIRGIIHGMTHGTIPHGIIHGMDQDILTIILIIMDGDGMEVIMEDGMIHGIMDVLHTIQTIIQEAEVPDITVREEEYIITATPDIHHQQGEAVQGIQVFLQAEIQVLAEHLRQETILRVE